MSNPKISIVLPCYNGAAMLPQAIESVLSQTFQDWELIIVNDCSTDNTLEVAKRYEEKDNRIKVLSNEKNSKLPASLNNGFRNAHGEYWTWTSDDNILLPNYAEEMTKFLDEHPDVGFVVSDEQRIDMNGQVYANVSMPDNLQLILPLNCYIGGSFMYRSSVAKTIGEYREDLFLVEDFEYFLRLNDACGVSVLHKTLYQYRANPCSLTSTRQKEIQKTHNDFRIEYLNKAERHFKSHPKLMAQYYNMIVDNASGMQRVNFFYRFAKLMPILFGVKYCFVHIPHKFVKKII